MHASPVLVYSMVMLLLLLESTGIPLTNTTLLLCTGALASFGHINFWILFVAALCGSILGACSAYLVGARGGHTFLVRLAAFFHVDEQRVVIAERWCMRSGLWMVFLSRITPYIRPLGCFPAGISQMNFAWFLGAASCGSLLWCSVLLTLGWSLGHHWMQALMLIQHYTLPAIGLLVVSVALYSWVMYVVKARLKNRLKLKHNLLRHYEVSSDSMTTESQIIERDLINV
jgi:membrane protein DedA with SNARE-associated domain